MLLYVDKKRQKRRQIKIILTTLFCILALILNIIHFNTDLNNTSRRLSSYQDIKKTQTWYNKAQIVQIFHPKTSKIPKAILIPNIINRENSFTIALAFSKLSQQNFNLVFTPEIKEQEYIQSLANVFSKSSQNEETPKKIIISTDIENLQDEIIQNKLYPSALNYRHSKKIQQQSELTNLINQRFPLKKLPKNNLEKEKQSLDRFAASHQQILCRLITENKKHIPFKTQSLLLKNNSICLSSNSTKICTTNSNLSLIKNLKTAQQKMKNTGTHPTSLHLLTSLSKIAINTPLEDDEGLAFKYGKRTAFLLPHEKEPAANNYTKLKLLSGINPDYHAPEMKFYKFKTTEIKLNDKI